MENEKFNIHYVCTLSEAERLINHNSEYWVSSCGCRERKGECSQSKPDVCLSFIPEFGGTGSGNKQVSQKEALEILKHALEKRLVPRPFRNPQDQVSTVGVCFCCSDCCEYFLNKDEECDKGAFIEKTDMDICINCGACVPVCYFDARALDSKGLRITRDNCYGCGLCVPECPVSCIKMVER